jgi:CIDE-N domain.
MEVSYITRPYKVATINKKFKGIVAANLVELKEKSVESLDIQFESLVDIHVYLAEDDTLVDDQDYFATIPENTKLIIRNSKAVLEELDVVDAPAGFEVSESLEFSNTFRGISSDLGNKLSKLDSTQSIMNILCMTNDELEEIVNIPESILVEELGFESNVAGVLVDSASKELVRRNDLNDATNLLKLYERAKTNKDMVDGTKRKKT